MKNEYYGADKASIEKTEQEYGHLLDDPSIESFTDWALPNSAPEVDNNKILLFEEEHGESFYSDIRNIVKT